MVCFRLRRKSSCWSVGLSFNEGGVALKWKWSAVWYNHLLLLATLATRRATTALAWARLVGVGVGVLLLSGSAAHDAQYIMFLSVID